MMEKIKIFFYDLKIYILFIYEYYIMLIQNILN